MVVLDVLQKALEVTLKAFKLDCIFPVLRRHPLKGTLFYFFERSVSLKEEVQFLVVELVLSIHDHGCHLEREYQFMGFEDTHAYELVE
jgi:hypothetical protein